MRSGIVLSVREKATRLPGKVLKPLGDYSVTEFLLRRLKQTAEANQIVLATSNDVRDDVLIEIAKKVEVCYFRGSEDDKLIRYRDAAIKYSLGFVVIVDGDDPFCSVEHIDKIISYSQAHQYDYVQYDQLPVGATGFGIRTTALARVCEEKTETNTEIWQHLFKNNPSVKAKLLVDERPLVSRPDVRMTLDYQQDYDFFVKVVDGLKSNNLEPSFFNIMTLLDSRPDLVNINAALQEDYELHLTESMAKQ